MKIGNWSWIFKTSKTHLDLKNVMGVSWYSLMSSTTRGAKMEGPAAELFRRIAPFGHPSISLVPLLDQWVAEGNPVHRQLLNSCIRRLRSYKRYSQALEMSFWMSDKRYFPVWPTDIAIRLDLITKVHGIEDAENYFNNVPKQLKDVKVYGALLHCYAQLQSVEKAEVVLQKLRELGLLVTTVTFNSLLSLYYKTGNYQKLEALMHEMEEKSVAPDVFTYSICLSSYAAQCNVDGIDNVLEKVESGCRVALPWHFYNVAADAYIKVGHVDKALAMLNKFEVLAQGRSSAYIHLLEQYARLGKKEEVLRIWELFKQCKKVFNKDYIVMIASLVKFDDIESAEKIFDEWESQTPLNLTYHTRVPNLLLGAYARKGLLEKFESFVNRIILKGGKPDYKTWYHFATVLCLHNEMEKAVNAMKEAVLISSSRWKASDAILAACLKYLKGEGDVDEAEKFINLLFDKGIISAEAQVKLLSYIKDGNADSTLDEVFMTGDGALHRNAEEVEESSIDCTLLAERLRGMKA